MSTRQVPDFSQSYHWIVDETPSVFVGGDELPTRKAEPKRRRYRSVYLGTVLFEGVQRRVFRHGKYGRIEGVTQGFTLEGIRGMLDDSEASKLDWNGPRYRELAVDVPALPQGNAGDSALIRLKCTGPGGCRVLVGLPSGRVRADGPGCGQIAMQALDWVAGYPHPELDEADDEVVWRFDPEYPERYDAAGSLARHLDYETGEHGKWRHDMHREALAAPFFDD